MTEHALEARTAPGAAGPVEDLRVRGVTRLITPSQIKEQLPASGLQTETVLRGRQEARAILGGDDERLLVVVGPCSIHDPGAAFDYARRLAALSSKVADRCLIVMRVYFEKPRTTIGWKGLINDPFMNDSCDMAYGLALARKILLEIAELGLPAGTEFLDPIVPQYIADLITWSAIGARTTESQTHREMASGLSMPVGFKNGTDGSVQTAIDAMKSSRTPHSFLGIDQDGSTSIIKTTGNPATGPTTSRNVSPPFARLSGRAAFPKRLWSIAAMPTPARIPAGNRGFGKASCRNARRDGAKSLEPCSKATSTSAGNR